MHPGEVVVMLVVRSSYARRIGHRRLTSHGVRAECNSMSHPTQLRSAPLHGGDYFFPVGLLSLDRAVVESSPEAGQLSHSGLSPNKVSHQSLSRALNRFLELGLAYLNWMRRLVACALPFTRSIERAALFSALLRVSNAGAFMHWMHSESCFGVCAG